MVRQQIIFRTQNKERRSIFSTNTKKSLILVPILLLNVVHFVSCGKSYESESSINVVPNVTVDHDQYIRSRFPVYLGSMPFTYISDGCYARGLIISADLSTQDIPVETVNQSVDRRGKDRLETASGTRWNYHTAPMYYYEGQPYVIDPAHSKIPLTKAEWERRNNVNNVQTETKVSPRNKMGGNSLDDRFNRRKIPFEDPDTDMSQYVNGKFEAKTLWNNTNTLSEYINKETISEQKKEKKRQNLEKLLHYISIRLYDKKRLAGVPKWMSREQIKSEMSRAVYGSRFVSRKR